MSDYQKDMEELLAAVSVREAVDILYRQLTSERQRREEAEARLALADKLIRELLPEERDRKPFRYFQDEPGKMTARIRYFQEASNG